MFSVQFFFLYFFFCKAGEKSKKQILANLCNSEKNCEIGLHGGEQF